MNRNFFGQAIAAESPGTLRLELKLALHGSIRNKRYSGQNIGGLSLHASVATFEMWEL